MGKTEYHIDQKELQRYLDNTMSSKERHEFEKELLNHNFEMEAMEGLETLTGNEFQQDMTALSKRLKKRVSPKKNNFYLKIAATLSLIAVFSFLIFFFIKNNSSEYTEKSFSENKSQNKDTTFLRDSLMADTKNLENSIALAETNKEEEGSEEESRDFDKDYNNEKVEGNKKLEETNNRISDIEIKKDPISETIDKPTNKLDLSIAEAEPIVLEEFTLSDTSVRSEESLTGAVAGVDETDLKRERSGLFKSKSAEKSAAVPSAAPGVEDKPEKSKTRTISGIVVSGFDNSTLPGVSIIEKNTINGAVTDIDGKFYMDVSPLSEYIVVSFVGFKTEEIDISGRNEFTVVLNEDIQSLSEVVVTGYGYSRADTETVVNASPEEGFRDFNKYIKENLIYPEQALKNEIKGRVVVEFTVKTDGSLTNFRIIKSLGYGCDEEAIRLIKNGPKWYSSEVNGVDTEDTVRVTVRFR
ncbi:MAG: TonB family protein [Cyclobacteriaceae bacterium]|nr:TonB family protein [Cyclobacteriaceae bacterium]